MENTITNSTEIINVIRFKDLIPFNDNISLLNLMRNILNLIKETKKDLPDEIHNYYLAINQLRILNKYIPDLCYSTLNYIIREFSQLILFNNINISVTAIRLTTEIFLYQSNNEDLAHWLTDLVPMLLIKSISEDKNIKEEASLAMEELVENMNYVETIEVLLECSVDFDQQISDVSFDFLFKFFDKLERNILITFYEQIDWRDFLFTTILLYENDQVNDYSSKTFQILFFLDCTFKIFYDYDDYFINILSQIDNLDFHMRFDHMWTKWRLHVEGNRAYYNPDSIITQFNKNKPNLK